MKILLSEAQIIKLLKESYGNESYIDDLLDKMSGQGLSALSLKEKEDLDKMSRGEHVDFGDDEPEHKQTPQTQELPGNDIPVRDMFLEMMPDRGKFKVGDESWNLTKDIDEDGTSSSILISSNSGSSYIINPFHTDNEFNVIGVMKEYKFKVKTHPKTEEEMANFITEFINKDLAVIVRYIKTKE